jgi:hypothetical protein
MMAKIEVAANLFGGIFVCCMDIAGYNRNLYGKTAPTSMRLTFVDDKGQPVAKSLDVEQWSQLPSAASIPGLQSAL